MAIHHARPGELVDLEDWPTDVEPGQSHAIIVTDTIEVARLVMPEGKTLPEHEIAHPIIIQCVKGEIELTTKRARQALAPGQLVHLLADDPYSLSALEDSIVLLTIIGKSS